MFEPLGSRSRLNLEFLRKAAKRLLRAARAGDAAALSRLQTALPRLAALDEVVAVTSVTLADAQHAIAREHGHVNWAALKHHDDPLEQFLLAVRGGAYRQIVDRLAEFASLGSKSVHAAAALGDRTALEWHLDVDPLAMTSTHRDWLPLAYTSASPLHKLSPRHAAGLLECARLLLDRGGDPNAETASPEPGGTAAPLLFRAISVANMTITLLLQQRGAQMSTAAGQMYHGSGHPWMADVFREYFARPDVRERMKAHMAETRSAFAKTSDGQIDLRALYALRKPVGLPNTLRDVWAVLLERGYDLTRRNPDGGTAPHGLARAGETDLLELLIEKGLDVSVTDSTGHSVIATAERAGQHAIVDMLERHGVSNDASAVDLLMGACMRNDGPAATTLLDRDPSLLAALTRSDYSVLVQAACESNLARLALMLDLGFSPDGLGDHRATVLHLAAWHGRPDATGLLLQRRARVDIRDETYARLAVDWARHGSVHCRDAPEEYALVIAAIERAPWEPD